ncbi:MAG: alanine--tRNA ligase [Pseudomonadales bacterium]|jgi:alanyl-tRNA synthetase|nr:alanine--tRNA ligase [Pseudomonadales bacterium]MDP7144169.1 alanine--tRNA ligase [Pseudomonadales bacterium]MDP7357725.1 alanine--tRNA ligase [Pseudomonadales bacterium]HJN50427.1 alanine--tRNA ligase [Pseudomonadales bacterium]|tara:strand:- start:632 stop:3229 length:2598 start_codon:yes stop_codon:yes gene_type:complete
MHSSELRQLFLDFFESKNHQIVDSGSLIPDNDPTLLFTNAGMVQFKDALAQREDRGYVRAASCQRCVRAGGKHNDLENVGYTERHHTFFEMLGNFSFGDYFKRDAIQYAWEFLTEVLKIAPEKLWITVHEDDKEAEDIWLNEIGADSERLSRLGDEENFWTMGDTGPCGPSSEIFYDHGPTVAGGPPGSPDDDLDRYVEVWNLVFTQFDRSADGTLTPLPKPCVDTGMGLERLAAVMQGGHSNYDIDLFQNLLKKASEILSFDDRNHSSLKVIVDHIRSCSFLIADGVVPSNEGRGYVLRRIIRRALRHGHQLQARDPFFYKLVEPLVADMGQAYPLLAQTREQIARILLKEEKQFDVTLDQGLRILSSSIRDLDSKVIPGDVIFKLYDTFGFPVDLTGDIARERGMTLDMDGFESAMEEQRQRGRRASKFGAETLSELGLEGVTQFTGYESLSGESAITALFKGDASVQVLNAGDEGLLVLQDTPFYAEAGGQVGDKGQVTTGDASFVVVDTLKEGDSYIHKGKVLRGEVAVGEIVTVTVDEPARNATVLNHSGTHLLHAALRTVLGEHVRQRGSLVDPDHLRFDFSHFDVLSQTEITQIERLVNEQIRGNTSIETEILGLEEAKRKGAMAMFGEKYSAKVRVLTMGEGFSVELCGGTHASRTGDIGLLKITSQQGIAAGVRRIEAVTGSQAVIWVEQLEEGMNDSAQLLKSDRDGVVDKVKSILEQNHRLEKELQAANAKLTSKAGRDIADQAVDVNGVKVVASRLDNSNPKALLETLDQLKDKLQSAVVVLGCVNKGKVSLIAGVTSNLLQQVQAGELVNMVATQVGGKGGGRPEMARAGGTDPDALPAALASVADWLKEKL